MGKQLKLFNKFLKSPSIRTLELLKAGISPHRCLIWQLMDREILYNSSGRVICYPCPIGSEFEVGDGSLCHQLSTLGVTLPIDEQTLPAYLQQLIKLKAFIEILEET
jgi:hypothetical protein